MNSKHLLLVLGLVAAATPTAFAVEGAIGRPVSGMAINPYAGIIPPAPGFIAPVNEIYYDAHISGARSTPLGNSLAVGVDTEISFTNLGLNYIWCTPGTSWNFASAVVLPVANVEVSAKGNLGEINGSRKESEFGLFDLAVVPVFASYHISQTEHIGVSLTIWAPTGKYDASNLANLSLNNWTFIPSGSYTKLWVPANIELSASWGMQFYTENPDTDFRNGIVSDLEATAIKRFSNGFGAGVIGSWIEQLTDDEGDTADLLDGFRGSAFGVGPILTYTKKFGESQLDLSTRWVREFAVEKRFGGDVFSLSAAWKF